MIDAALLKALLEEYGLVGVLTLIFAGTWAKNRIEFKRDAARSEDPLKTIHDRLDGHEERLDRHSERVHDVELLAGRLDERTNK